MLVYCCTVPVLTHVESWYERVSRVHTYQTGPRAKLESERVKAVCYLTKELLSGRGQPQSTPRSMCPKAAMSRAKTQWTDWEAFSLPSIDQPPSGTRRKCRAQSLSTANDARVKKSTNSVRMLCKHVRVHSTIHVRLQITLWIYLSLN